MSLIDEAIAAGKDAVAIGEKLLSERDDFAAKLSEIEWLCDGREDIDNNGGPNLAMQIMQTIRGQR